MSETVYGWREWILFEGKEVSLRAKLDTGARTSTIHAEEIEGFRRDGEDWVGFTVSDPKRDVEKEFSVRYECPVVRLARIRNADGLLSERFVVELIFWIGGVRWTGEFSLNSRSEMINPVLLGRKMIREMGLVDSGRSFLMGKSPQCAPESGTIVTSDEEADDDELN